MICVGDSNTSRITVINNYTVISNPGQCDLISNSFGELEIATKINVFALTRKN